MGEQTKMAISVWDESIPLEQRLDYIVGELTIEEKIQCLTTRQTAIPRLGLPEFAIGGEAAHGVEARHDQVFNEGASVPTTVFTQPIGMSATWNEDLIYQAGEVTGVEARAVFAGEGRIGLSRWAPTVDMERDPRWGRNEEGYGEDPYLTGKMASAYIKGMQGEDPFYLRCGASLKHFYANNQEEDRNISSSSLDRRNKWEYYLEPFRRTIMEGRCESVMTSYNEINGVPAILNPEVKNLLKEKFGLKGHVVCDMADLAQTKTDHKCVKTDAEALSLAMKAGIDSFNDPEDFVIATAKEALSQGLITEKEIDKAIKRTFATKLRLGYGKESACPYNKIGSLVLNCSKHRQISKKVAKECVVLLKNEGNLLPLTPKENQAISVTGPLASEWFQDWYAGNPQKRITPVMGMEGVYGKDSLTVYDGTDRVMIHCDKGYLGIDKDGTCLITDKQHASLFLYCDWGEYGVTLREASTMKYVTWDFERNVMAAIREEVFSWMMEEVFFMEQADGEGVLWKLHEGSFAGVGEDGIVKPKKEELAWKIERMEDGIEKAVRQAASSDVAVVVLGGHPIICGKEGHDRKTLMLPKHQQQLLEAVYKANANTVLVLIANYPYTIGWAEENIPAILLSASGSQDLGSGIAEVLSGESCPAGRLNMTWYQSESQLTNIMDYDIIQGKRTYQYFDGPVLYPFGYGKSYTQFRYDSLSVAKKEKAIEAVAAVTNIGNMDGDEVVQLYIRQLASRTVRPIRQLKGFKRCHIKKGETAVVSFEIPLEELRYYDVVTCKMVLEESDYEIQVGASSEDIRMRKTVFVAGTVIPNRDMETAIACDQYDESSNIVLVKGTDDMPAMMPKDPAKSAAAVYRDAAFVNQPVELEVLAMAKTSGKITVWIDEKQWGAAEVEQGTEYKKVIIKADNESVAAGFSVPICIEMEGGVRILSFRFHS